MDLGWLVGLDRAIEEDVRASLQLRVGHLSDGQKITTAESQRRAGWPRGQGGSSGWFGLVYHQITNRKFRS
jgi:hypothetical protein